jgi:uncharacterized protein YnzC (UPF0291/DUF896 family)
MWFFPKTISGRAKSGAASAVAHPLTADEAEDTHENRRRTVETIRKQLRGESVH